MISCPGGMRRTATMFLLLFIFALAATRCDSTKPREYGDPLYVISGTAQDSLSGLPLADVLVFCSDTIHSGAGADSATTDSTGYYWVGVDFWMHGKITFEKHGYQAKTFDVLSEPVRISTFMYSLDVLLVED